MKKMILASLMVFGFSTASLAHEGHDQIPGALKARHGGVVKAGKQFNLEMLTLNDTVEFFPTAHEDESLEFKDVKLTVKAKTPKGKPQELPLQKTANSFKGTLNFQGSYRLDLEVTTEYEGKKDSFKFLAEK